MTVDEFKFWQSFVHIRLFVPLKSNIHRTVTAFLRLEPFILYVAQRPRVAAKTEKLQFFVLVLLLVYGKHDLVLITEFTV